MSSFPFPSLIAVALSVMTYSLLQREWGLAILMGVISLLLFILLVLVSRQRQDRGEGSITPFILSIGKAVPADLFCSFLWVWDLPCTTKTGFSRWSQWKIRPIQYS